MKKNYIHKPVLVNEVLENIGAHLNKQDSLKGKKIVDATLGLGGHSLEFVKLGASVLGIDADEKNLLIAEKRISDACPSHLNNKVGHVTCVKGNFKDIEKITKDQGFSSPDVIFYDLGLNMLQQKSKERGFSFSNEEAPLDMRLNDKEQAVKASDLLNSLPERSLFELFEEIVGFRQAREISRKVVDERKKKPFETVGDFLKLLPEKKEKKTHPATKYFMALRIAVNSELVNLKESLNKSIKLLKTGGKILVITFHSGEDRIVKNLFKEFEEKNFGRVLNKKPVVSSEKELEENKSARSAKLRIFQKN